MVPGVWCPGSVSDVGPVSGAVSGARPSACLRAPRGHPSAVSGLSPGPWGRPSALSRGPGRVTQQRRAGGSRAGARAGENR
ncbi:hypothetical protein NDU88_002866 [Pleurodeles waltl]|uniref:Uncharacterized protein n=1 Tax=Pleurodeles waltl TaxID=8319 RepID=A0AAV7W3N1_PLEWA|nr:hypothetical protein NDU88_002866 [Pleurodeles waltl]